MSEKETLRQKIERVGLSASQNAFVLAIVLSSLGIVLTLPFWILSLFRDFIQLQLFFGYLVCFLVFTFIVTGLEKRLRQIKPKREGYSVSFKSNLKSFSIYFLVWGTVITGFFILEMYFLLFPETIRVEMGIDILKTIIQANGFLIGLSGVVFAQMLWAINHQQNTIQAELLKKSKPMWSEVKVYYVNALDKKRRDMTINMAIVIGLFTISIALSLSAMARTESNTTEILVNPDIRNPLLCMILGIVFFVIFIATSKMSLEKLEG